jgi:hypothetical protein
MSNHVPRSKHPWNPWITACTTALRASPSSTLGLLRSRFTPSASLPVAELEAEDNSGASWCHIVGATLFLATSFIKYQQRYQQRNMFKDICV